MCLAASCLVLIWIVLWLGLWLVGLDLGLWLCWLTLCVGYLLVFCLVFVCFLLMRLCGVLLILLPNVWVVNVLFDVVFLVVNCIGLVFWLLVCFVFAGVCGLCLVCCFCLFDLFCLWNVGIISCFFVVWCCV